jgi:hypothetical protein
MSHCIELPIDEVYTTSGTSEWHGLAVPPLLADNGKIGEATVKRLCPSIREMQVTGFIDGVAVALPNYKALVADYRECRPEVVLPDGSLSEFAFVPLHIPKSGYKVIGNCELHAALVKAIEGVDAEIVTAGTLGAGKRAFFSVDIKGHSEIELKRTVRGVTETDKLMAFLNIVTSHDGTLAAKGYDSTVRIVCQNTLDWSLSAAGEVGFNVYHTAGAEVAVSKMGDLLNAILLGRANFKDSMSLLDSVAVSHADAHKLAVAYFVYGQSAGETELQYELSKKALNAADEISTLFSRGRGNRGVSLYDLLNGATDYWTNGNGTGKKASRFEKLSKANFATAAEHKQAFRNLLLSIAGGYSKELAVADKALSISAK